MGDVDKKTLELIRSSSGMGGSFTSVPQCQEKNELYVEGKPIGAAQESAEAKPEEQAVAPAADTSPEAEGPPKDGCCELYDKQGKLMQRLYYSGGKRNGAFEIFSEGVLLQTGEYKDDLIEGQIEIFDKSGQAIARVVYVGGKKNGPAQFFREGCLVIENHYKEDVLDGPTVAYYPGSKQKSMEAFYKDGLYDGRMTVYAESGSVARVTDYISGKKHGPSVSYYPTSELFEEASFAEDMQCGVMTQYYQDGTKKYERHFDLDGKAVREVTYNTSGQVISDSAQKAPPKA